MNIEIRNLNGDEGLEVADLWHTRRTLKEVLRERLNLSANVDPEASLAKEVVAWITKRPKHTYYVKKISKGSLIWAGVTFGILSLILAGLYGRGIDPKFLPETEKNIILLILLVGALLFFMGTKMSSLLRKTELHDEDILQAMKTAHGEQQMSVLLDIKNDFCNGRLAYAIMYSAKSVSVLPPLTFETVNSLNILLPTVGNWKLVDGFEGVISPKVYVIDMFQCAAIGTIDEVASQDNEQEQAAHNVTNVLVGNDKSVSQQHDDDGGTMGAQIGQKKENHATRMAPLYCAPAKEIGKWLLELVDLALFEEVERLSLSNKPDLASKFQLLRLAKKVRNEFPALKIMALASEICSRDEENLKVSTVYKLISGRDPAFEPHVVVPKKWP